MFEGPIKAVDLAWSEETPILRQLRWTDLVARIAATRDLRAAPQFPAECADDVSGNFAAFHLGDIASDSAEKDQRAINRDVLSHGKMTRVHPSDTATIADSGDREI